VKLNLDGKGAAKLSTGLPFLEHMLDQVARHGMLDLDIEAKGDLHIDAHHTVEDIGITLASMRIGTKAIGEGAPLGMLCRLVAERCVVMPMSSTVWCASMCRSPSPRCRGRACRGAPPGRACARGTAGGGKLGGALPVEVELHPDLRFLRTAGDFGLSHFRAFIYRASRKAVRSIRFSSGVPTVMRRQFFIAGPFRFFTSTPA